VSDELLNIFLSLHNTETWGQFHHHFYLRIFRTNIVLTAFSSYVWLWGKIRTFNVDEIDNRGQFYLRFTRTFLVQKSLSSFFLLSFGFEFLAPIFCTKNAWVKHWWNWLQGSFLSTYLCGFFWAQDRFKAFFGVHIWQTSFGKFQHTYLALILSVKLNSKFFFQTLCSGVFSLVEQSLVKLTPSVNFINVKRPRFSYEHHFSSYMYVVKAAKTYIRTKNLYVKMLVKLTPCGINMRRNYNSVQKSDCFSSDHFAIFPSHFSLHIIWFLNFILHITNWTKMFKITIRCRFFLNWPHYTLREQSSSTFVCFFFYFCFSKLVNIFNRWRMKGKPGKIQ